MYPSPAETSLCWLVGAEVEFVLKGRKVEIFETAKAIGITSLSSAIGPTAIAAMHKEYCCFERMVAQPSISRALKGMHNELLTAGYDKYFITPTDLISSKNEN